MNTETKIRTLIGELMVQNIALAAQVEELTARVKELTPEDAPKTNVSPMGAFSGAKN